MRREDLPITTPCQADWTKMTPAQAKARFCGDCKKHVHDLSRMSREEARVLLASAATDGLCVRYLYDMQGNVLFEEKRLLAKAKRFVAATVALAVPMTLNACMGAMPMRVPPPSPTNATSTTAPSASAVPSAPDTAPRETTPAPIVSPR